MLGNLGAPELILILIVIGVFFAFSRRSTYVRVHNFNYKDVPLPSLSEKVPGEQTLSHASSISNRMQFFVTNKRILVFNKTLFGSQHYSRYFPIDSLSSAQVGYKNPFGLLIFAGLVVIGAFIQYSDSSRRYYGGPDSSIMIIAIIVAGFLSVLWYTLRSYAIVLKNLTATFTILSRSETDLSKVLAQIDALRIK